LQTEITRGGITDKESGKMEWDAKATGVDGEGGYKFFWEAKRIFSDWPVLKLSDT
jgi:hypothetical protein